MESVHDEAMTDLELLDYFLNESVPINSHDNAWPEPDSRPRALPAIAAEFPHANLPNHHRRPPRRVDARSVLVRVNLPQPAMNSYSSSFSPGWPTHVWIYRSM